MQQDRLDYQAADQAVAGNPSDEACMGSPREASGPPVDGSPPALRTIDRDQVGVAVLPRREVVGVVVIAVLALVCVALIVVVAQKSASESERAAREAATYSPPPLSSSGSTAVIGDAAALVAAEGVLDAKRWPALLERRSGTTVDLDATADAGYTVQGTGRRTFVESAARVPEDAAVVIFAGGAADSASSSLQIARAATQAFAAASQAAPDARIIAVGPFFAPSGRSAREIRTVRGALRSAAGVAGVRWIDPIDQKWLKGVRAEDQLTSGRERIIATRLARLVDFEAR